VKESARLTCPADPHWPFRRCYLFGDAPSSYNLALGLSVTGDINLRDVFD